MQPRKHLQSSVMKRSSIHKSHHETSFLHTHLYRLRSPFTAQHILSDNCRLASLYEAPIFPGFFVLDMRKNWLSKLQSWRTDSKSEALGVLMPCLETVVSRQVFVDMPISKLEKGLTISSDDLVRFSSVQTSSWKGNACTYGPRSLSSYAIVSYNSLRGGPLVLLPLA